ncbi:UPF0182 family membrane protein [Rothia nasisuis]|uniref:UPF0182 family membrane protein n=1 Tax=Rothia nasisuis TaxID=2109647 RepID=UPI001F445016|nr:UPF0182 family protein [Rothia nasisuis]
MSTGSTPPRTPRAPRRQNRPLLVTVAIIAALIVAFVFATQVYTDILWYDQLGYLTVFITQNLTRAAVFVAAALIAGLAVWASLYYAYKRGTPQAPTPRSRPAGPRVDENGNPLPGPYADIQDLFNQNMERYRQGIDKMRKAMLILVPVLLGAFVGAGAMTQWETVLLFFNGEPFGATDPEFGLDLGYFLFTLPFLNFITGLLSTVIIFSAMAALAMHYFYGGLMVSEKGMTTTVYFRRHFAVLGALFILVRAITLWLARYNATQDQSGSWAGAMYSDVNAIIPVNAILALASLLVAALFVVAAFKGNFRLPIIGTVVLVIASLVAGGLYPWVVQRFQVVPNEQATEAPYIQRNIDATRVAYGLDSIDVQNYDATTSTEAGALRGESETISNIRLLDPNVVSGAFAQLQQFRPYYQFGQNLSVDRYSINGTETDTVIAARELNPAQNAGSSWVNQHVVYTHGFGVIAAYGNQVEADGKPKFIQSGIQATGAISGDYEPRIYFGQSSPDYSIVGGAAEDEPLELDRPQTADDQSGSDAKYTFSGNGGPNIGNAFNRLAYAIKFQSSDILLSDAVRPESQVLYDRDPSDRVKKVAPYLTVDGNPYPAIIDGQVLWIVDAYTTSDQYPYAQAAELENATADSETATGVSQALPNKQVNYIRNSVKATVNAYDGSVTLYAWDDQDPVLKSWQKVYPETVRPYSEMSASLIEHVRYPQDLFKVQREVLNAYHVTNANSLYAGDDLWSIPNDPTNESGRPLPPYYMSLQMPGAESAAFSLTTSFIPQQSDSNTRNVMYGFLSANGDAGTGKDGEKHEDYGKLTLLELPRSSVVPGPGQAQNVFNSDTAVSTELNLLRQGASDVINGNLLTLPVGGGILYVQPVYVQSSGDAAYPSLRRVLVGFGEKVGFAPTLEEALDELFSGSSGAETATDAGVNETEAAQATDETAPPVDSADLTSALQDARAAMQDADAAMKAGDWAAYGEAQNRLNEALQRAIDAEGLQGTATTDATPTPSPSN